MASTPTHSEVPQERWYSSFAPTRVQATTLASVFVLVTSATLVYTLSSLVPTTLFVSFVVAMLLVVVALAGDYLYHIPRFNALYLRTVRALFDELCTGAAALASAHPRALTHLRHVTVLFSLLTSYAFLTAHTHIVSHNASLLGAAVTTLFLLVTRLIFLYAVLQLFCLSYAMLTVTPSFALLDHKFLPLLPALLVAFVYASTAASPFLMAGLVFAAVFSFTSFASLLLLFPFFWFCDRAAPVDMKRLFLLLPVMTASLVVFLVSFLILLLPGSSLSLPDTDWDNTTAPLPPGGYNSIAREYAATSSLGVRLLGRVVLPVSSDLTDILVVVPPLGVPAAHDGYADLVSFLASHNVAVAVINATELDPLLLSPAAFVVLHHLAHLSSFHPRRFHLLGHGSGANAALVAARALSAGFPDFPLFVPPSFPTPLASVFALAPASGSHPLLSVPIPDVAVFALNALASPTFPDSVNALAGAGPSASLRASLGVYGALSSRFNAALDPTDDPVRPFENNAAAFLSAAQHRAVLRLYAYAVVRHTAGTPQRVLRDPHVAADVLPHQLYVATFREGGTQLLSFPLAPGTTLTTTAIVQAVEGAHKLVCAAPPCEFVLSLNTSVSATRVCIDATAEHTTDILFAVNDRTTTLHIPVVAVVNTTKFVQTTLPRARLLQTHTVEARSGVKTIALRFEETLFVANIVVVDEDL